MVPDPFALLLRAYRAGVAAAQPERATREAVLAMDELADEAWIFSVGKAAHGMAAGAVAALGDRKRRIGGGLVVAAADDPAPTHGLPSVAGDHPEPGHRSLRAAARLEAAIAEVPASADAVVLLSGGTTSLIAAPASGLTSEDLRETFRALLASGADITTVNAIRKRILRFGAGRLAVALAARRVHVLVVSDVVGNDLASIGSGPCTPERATAASVRERAQAAGAWDVLPVTVRRCLDEMAAGRRAGAPSPEHPRFATTHARVILSRLDAERGTARFLRASGVAAVVRRDPLRGEAALAGRRLAGELVECERSRRPRAVIRSGETTVALSANAPPGGRCQELALACAIALERAPNAGGITVLAAGTDGRDGPTDAAGAVVDAGTCSRIREHGLDPVAALADHASYAALDAAGALIRTGPTGTNVNDVVIGLVPPLPPYAPT